MKLSKLLAAAALAIFSLGAVDATAGAEIKTVESSFLQIRRPPPPPPPPLQIRRHRGGRLYVHRRYHHPTVHLRLPKPPPPPPHP